VRVGAGDAGDGLRGWRRWGARTECARTEAGGGAARRGDARIRRRTDDRGEGRPAPRPARDGERHGRWSATVRVRLLERDGRALPLRAGSVVGAARSGRPHAELVAHVGGGAIAVSLRLTRSARGLRLELVAGGRRATFPVATG
jgi:hypothetical protein